LLDQQSDPKVAQSFAEGLLIVALISGERPQIAHDPAGDLLGEICVASFSVCRAVNVKDSLRRCIDEFRDLQLLNTVADSMAVAAARC